MNIEYIVRETDNEVHVIVHVPEHDVGDHQYEEHYVFPTTEEGEAYLEYWEQDGEGQHTGISDIRVEVLAMVGVLGYTIIQ